MLCVYVMLSSKVMMLPHELQWKIQSYLSNPTADIIKANVKWNTPLPWHLLDVTDSESDDE